MCNCAEMVNKKLAENNTRLEMAYTYTGEWHLVIATEKVDKKIRKGPVRLFPSHCPFCGEGKAKLDDI